MRHKSGGPHLSPSMAVVPTDPLASTVSASRSRSPRNASPEAEQLGSLDHIGLQ